MIHSVRLQNFKSFVDETVHLGPLTVVVGGNGAGKSNFFDALRFLRSIGEGRSVRDAIEGHALPGALSPAVAGIRGGGASAVHFRSGSGRFAVEVLVSADDQVVTYSVEVDVRRHRVVSEELSSSTHPGPYVFSTHPETGPLEQHDESPVIAARFHKTSRGLNPKRDFTPTEFILSQFTSRRAESRLNEDVADLLRAELTSIAPLELQPEVLRRYAPLGRLDMGEHGENFAAAVWKLNEDAEVPVGWREVDGVGEVPAYDEAAQARRAAVVAWLSQVTPRSISQLSTQSSPTGEVIATVVEAPYSEPVAAPSLSDGTLRFAALAVAALGKQGRRTMVVEELENGINPARLALLVRMFEQITASDSQLQVVASTHSAAILDYASTATADQAVVIGWDEESAGSRAMPIKALPGLATALETQTLGSLQEEGWLQLAASV